jgi:outer membrane biosynthesis protein TonB
MNESQSKGKGGTIGIILMLVVLVGVGVGAALLLTKKKTDEQPAEQETQAAEQEVEAPSSRLVEAPPPLPEKPPVVEEEPEEEPEDTAEPEKKKHRRKAMPTGTIDVKAAQAVTKKNYTKVRACYEKQLKVNHLLQGNIKVRITVYPDGSVNSVRFVQDTMHNSAMNKCIKREIMSWKFPKPQGGKVDINQSYRLEPKAG